MKLLYSIASFLLAILTGAICLALIESGDHLRIAALSGIMCGFNIASWVYNIMWYIDGE